MAEIPSYGEDWRETNRALWDEHAAAHAESDYYDLDAVAAGRDDLRFWEDEELGSVAGRDLVHLQCHLGTDTVAWARRGAHVVGLDFSAVALEAATDLGRRGDVSSNGSKPMSTTPPARSEGGPLTSSTPGSAPWAGYRI